MDAFLEAMKTKGFFLDKEKNLITYYDDDGNLRTTNIISFLLGSNQSKLVLAQSRGLNDIYQEYKGKITAEIKETLRTYNEGKPIKPLDPDSIGIPNSIILNEVASLANENPEIIKATQKAIASLQNEAQSMDIAEVIDRIWKEVDGNKNLKTTSEKFIAALSIAMSTGSDGNLKLAVNGTNQNDKLYHFFINAWSASYSPNAAYLVTDIGGELKERYIDKVFDQEDLDYNYWGKRFGEQFQWENRPELDFMRNQSKPLKYYSPIYYHWNSI